MQELYQTRQTDKCLSMSFVCFDYNLGFVSPLWQV